MAWIRCIGNKGGSLKLNTASGAIASFETNLPEPLQSVLVNVEATGGNGAPDNPNPINGYTEANITRCGVNLFDGEWTLIGSWYISDNFITVKAGQTYYVYTPNVPSGENLYCDTYDATKTIVESNKVMGRNATFTIPSGVAYIKIKLWNEFDTTNICINYPSTDTTYHPYTGNTYTIAFGQTVYGGVLDVTRGKLHITWAEIDIGDINWTYLGSLTIFYSALTNTKTTYNYNALCSCYPKSNDTSQDKVFGNTSYIGSGNNIWIKDSSFTDVATLKTTLRGQKIAYELATPFDIDLTPEVISAVVGENNVFADCGETTVGYYTSIGENIHDLVEESVELWTDISGTLEAGETEITLTNSAITTSSTIEVFNELDVPYVSKELSAGSITLTFDAQESDMSVKVRVS